MWRVVLDSETNDSLNRHLKATLPKEQTLTEKGKLVVAAWMNRSSKHYLVPEVGSNVLRYSESHKGLPDIYVLSSTKEMKWAVPAELPDKALVACVYMHGWASNIAYLEARQWAAIKEEARTGFWAPSITRNEPVEMLDVSFRLTPTNEADRLSA